jgi:hypothetical protein
VAAFHAVFLITAVIPLLAIPGFLALSPQAGVRPMTPEQTIAEAEGSS